MHTIEGEVSAAYSQIELHPGENGAIHAAFDVGLARAERPDCAILTTARQWGSVHVSVTVHDEQPTADPSWDAVVEMSMVVGDGAEVTGWASEGEQLLLPVPAGTAVRVRYIVVDGEAGGEQDEDEPAREQYLLQLWPAPAAAAAVVVSATPWSRYWVESAAAIDGWEVDPEHEWQCGARAPTAAGTGQEDPSSDFFINLDDPGPGGRTNRA